MEERIRYRLLELIALRQQIEKSDYKYKRQKIIDTYARIDELQRVLNMFGRY